MALPAIQIRSIQFVRRVMVILSIDVVAPGSEVGHKIGNPTNADNKAEPESAKMANASTAAQTSNIS